jgi:hypothetical protein
MEVVYLLIGLSVATALIPACVAKSKGRSFGQFFIYGAMLGPIAIIHALVIERQTVTTRAEIHPGGEGSKNVLTAQREFNRKLSLVSTAVVISRRFRLRRPTHWSYQTNAKPLAQFDCPSRIFRSAFSSGSSCLPC